MYASAYVIGRYSVTISCILRPCVRSVGRPDSGGFLADLRVRLPGAGERAAGRKSPKKAGGAEKSLKKVEKSRKKFLRYGKRVYLCSPVSGGPVLRCARAGEVH